MTDGYFVVGRYRLLLLFCFFNKIKTKNVKKFHNAGSKMFGLIVQQNTETTIKKPDIKPGLKIYDYVLDINFCVLGVALNKIPSWCNFITHQHTKHFIGIY